MQVLAAVALGSNLASAFGGPEPTLREAIRRIGELGRVVAVSSLRETEPVGYRDQPAFLNGALLLETGLSASELLAGLLAIERTMGRVREGVVSKGPRVLDLDLLLHDRSVLSSEELTVPHPAMHQRRFVLEPMAEIAPELVHPVLGRTMRRLRDELEARVF